MKSVVIDASVAAKWFLPEKGSKTAIGLLDGRRCLMAPDLIRSEVGNIFWKYQRRGLIAPEEAHEMITQFLMMPLQIHDSDSLLAAAFEIAVTTQTTVYDSMYVALAFQKNVTCVTADEHLVNALAPTPFYRNIRLLGVQKS